MTLVVGCESRVETNKKARWEVTEAAQMSAGASWFISLVVGKFSSTVFLLYETASRGER